jgi:hypothetical protein
MSNAQRLKNTMLWGFALWLIGYLAGIILFFVVPKDYIGWVITPLAIVLTIWVVMKKIKRPKLMCYFGLGLIWTIMAVALDFIFIVLLLHTGKTYYKPDVFLYYILTFSLPLIIGYWKFKHKLTTAELF